jgi:hypothetical protein
LDSCFAQATYGKDLEKNEEKYEKHMKGLSAYEADLNKDTGRAHSKRLGGSGPDDGVDAQDHVQVKVRHRPNTHTHTHRVLSIASVSQLAWQFLHILSAVVYSQHCSIALHPPHS